MGKEEKKKKEKKVKKSLLFFFFFSVSSARMLQLEQLEELVGKGPDALTEKKRRKKRKKKNTTPQFEKMDEPPPPTTITLAELQDHHNSDSGEYSDASLEDYLDQLDPVAYEDLFKGYFPFFYFLFRHHCARHLALFLLPFRISLVIFPFIVVLVISTAASTGTCSCFCLRSSDPSGTTSGVFFQGLSVFLSLAFVILIVVFCLPDFHQVYVVSAATESCHSQSPRCWRR